MTARLVKSDIAAVLAGLVVSLLVVALPPWLAFPLPLAEIAGLALVALIVRQDLSDFTIPDGPVIAIALIGAAVRLVTPADDIWTGLPIIALDAALCGGLLFLVRETYFRLRGVDGLGFGDVKLAAAAGALIGTTDFAWALLVASLCGLAVALGISLLSSDHKIERLAFGAFLAPVCWGFWVFAR